MPEHAIHTELVGYRADGLDMVGRLYVDRSASTPRPGVLVFPEAFGLSEHAKTRAERLAKLGYVALACDLHGEGRLLTDLAAVSELMKPMRDDPTGVRARAQGGLDALIARPEADARRVAAIGFCFGGTMALELARSGAAIAGAVGFHSGLATVMPADAKHIRGKVLVCIGADDPSIDAVQRTAFAEEMRAGGANWQMNVYGGAVHGFTNPASDAIGRPEFARYDAQADARSWAEMRSFFDEVFSAPPAASAATDVQAGAGGRRTG